MRTIWAIHTGTKSYSIFGMVELNCMMYLININLELIKLYYTNKVILSYLLFILLVLWYVEVSWGNLLAIHTETKHTQYFFEW